MLHSIYLIGKEISQGRDPWADILVGIKVQEKESNAKRYVLPLHFNLDTESVEIDPNTLFTYSHELPFLKKWRSLKIQGGNNKAIYLTVDAGKLEQLQKTLLGKKESSEQGELLEVLSVSSLVNIGSSPLESVLKKLPTLRASFMAWFKDETINTEKLTLKKVNEFLKLGKEDKIVMVTATVTCNTLGLERIFIGDLEPYDTFISHKFFKDSETQSPLSESTKGLCYASGILTEDLSNPDFSGRYNINKYFVQTTRNFATQFNSSEYRKNYQLSVQSLQYLDRGSDFLLNNSIATIAGIKHIVIPEFFGNNQPNIRDLGQLNKSLELMFGGTSWEAVYTYLEDNVEDEHGYYAINFITIDSDGNYFKASNLIRDVNALFLHTLFKTLAEVGKKYSPWLGHAYGFNLYTVYRAIPVRKKEAQSKALLLMQAILEQRKIRRTILFDYFKELILCHKYSRYRGYENIRERSAEQYDYALKDAVFCYQAFMETLLLLNLIEYQPTPIQMEVTKSISQEEEDFLRQLDYSEDQAALFYLGRVLSRVVYEQTRKRHKKNALDKLNYNGMDGQAIFRLANELFEAGRHYEITSKIVWSWGEFSQRFKLERWSMNPSEALFYILSGYTYRIRADKDKPDSEEASPE